ncbi:MAG: VanZ family protein [Salibacteraceae bacterium]
MYLSKNKVTILWALLVAVLSFLPGSKFPKTELTNIDLVVHFFFYCVFTFLLILGNVRQTQFSFCKNNPILMALSVSIPYGGVVEIIQGTKFVSRSAEFADFIANSIGSIIGVILFFIIYGSPKNFTTWNKKSLPAKITEDNLRNTSL